MDDFSRFVCCEIDEAENHVLIAKALQKFLTFTKYLMPYEVISDRHTAYQCKAFPNFNKFLKDNKLEWHKSKKPEA